MALLVPLRWASSFALCLIVFVLCALPSEGRTEVYLTKAQALEIVLGADTEHVYERKPVPSALKSDLVEQGLLSHKMKFAHFFVAKEKGEIRGYALIDNEVGKHLPITYVVGISPDGVVTRVEMMVFREIRGWEARERRFMRQFEGKGVSDPLKIGSTLKNVSGATLSSRAIAKGVQRALYLWRHFYDESESGEKR